MVENSLPRYDQGLRCNSQLRFELGRVVVLPPLGDLAVVAGDEDAGGEAGGVAGEAVAAGELQLAGGGVVLHHEGAHLQADLGKGAEERRKRLADGGNAAKRLAGGIGEDGVRREVPQDCLDVRGVPGGGLMLQDGGGCGWNCRHGRSDPCNDEVEQHRDGLQSFCLHEQRSPPYPVRGRLWALRAFGKLRTGGLSIGLSKDE